MNAAQSAFQRFAAKIPLWAKVVAVAGICSLLLYVRRSEQLLVPQVWDEEGTKIIKGLIVEGARSLLDPINGYLVTIPRLISAASLAISFSHYPLISTLFAWVLTIGVTIAIYVSPTKLRGRLPLVVATLLIPSDPEVFGVALYTFWWVSLLVFLVTLWQERSRDIAWRSLFVIAGGLSSPVILPALPLLWLRALIYRRFRREWIVTGIATACGGIQLVAILDQHVLLHADFHQNWSQLISKLLGAYLVGNLGSTQGYLLMAGLVMLAVIAAALWLGRTDVTLWFLVYLWAGCVAVTAARVSLSIVDPAVGGPRYFFFPFVLETWALIQIATLGGARWLRLAAAAMVVLSLANVVPVLSREHDDLHWQANVNACAQFPEYAIPVQFDGQAWHAWTFYLTGAQCRALLKRDRLNDIGRQSLSLTSLVYRPERAPTSLDDVTINGANHVVAALKSAMTFKIKDADKIVLSGWTFDPLTAAPAAAVGIQVGGREMIARYGGPRPDVAQVYSHSSLSDVAFRASLAGRDFSSGISSVAVIVYSSDQSSYYRVPSYVRFEKTR